MPNIASKYWSKLSSSSFLQKLETQSGAQGTQPLGMLQALTQAYRSEGLQGGSRILSCVSQLPTPTSGAVAYQLVVADRQVSYFSPVHQDHIKTALWLPAIDTQRILEAAVQAAAIRVEEHTPGRKAGGESGTAFPPCSVLVHL